MKGGQVLHGKVKREMELISDPTSGQVIPIVKATNCFLLDDGVRFVVFGLKQVENVDQDLDVRQHQLAFIWPRPTPPRLKLPPQASLGAPSMFDGKAERTILMTTPGSSVRVKQRVTLATPYVVRVQSFDYDWTVNYLTAELGPDIVLPLVRSNPDLSTKPDDFEQQNRVFRFCLQADWVAQASDELQQLRARFPNEKAKLGALQDQYRRSMVQRTWQSAELAAKVGRHVEAESLLANLPFTELPGPLQADAANLRTKYDGLRTQLKLARQMIDYCTVDIKGSERFTDALPVILRDLGYDTVDRAVLFSTLAKQAEQATRNGDKPKHSREDLLAVLVSGWVFGPTAADSSPKAASAAWELRNSLLALQRVASTADRKKFVEKLEAQLAFKLPEIAQAISLLPPVDSSEIALPTANGSTARQTKLSWARHGAFNYQLQLPLEYHPNRSYPLLLVLPNCGESPAEAIQPWAAHAMRNGYMIAAVDWGTGKDKYEYSEVEHAAVLDCIRDLKRIVNVDTDRIFLTGFGEGANMAFDVGLSHPDQFAGVLPVNGRPRWYSSMWYWRNAQNLPFYVVCGELTNDIRSWDANIYDRWVEKGYQSLMVMYRGRINEFYPAEVPQAFNWMEDKRRAPGFPELGRNPLSGVHGEEYQTFRTSDNWFYWVSTSSVDPKHLLDDFFKKSPTDRSSAAIQAVIRDNNSIQVHTRGIKQLSIWLGRVKDPAAGLREMVDFSKPLKVTVNSTVWTNQNQPVVPNLETLLEDFHTRCDRNRLFMVRLDFNIK